MDNEKLPFTLLILAIPSAYAEIGEIENRGYAASSVIWQDLRIHVCWENIHESTLEHKLWVRNAIESTWERHSDVQFIGWTQCRSSHPGIRIKVSDEFPHVQRLGNRLNGIHNGMG